MASCKNVVMYVGSNVCSVLFWISQDGWIDPRSGGGQTFYLSAYIQPNSCELTCVSSTSTRYTDDITT